MRPALILLPMILLASGPVLAQPEGSDPQEGPTAAESPRADSVTEVELTDIPVEELKGAPVYASDGVEVGRVSSAIPAENGIDSVLVDISASIGIGETSLSFLPADLTAMRSAETGAIRLVSTMHSGNIAAMAATTH